MRFKRLLLLLLVFSFTFSNVTVAYASDDEFKTFIQSDPRWGSYVYGGGCNLAAYGCAITSISILMAYANPDLRDISVWTPQVAAQKFSFSGGGIYWGSPSNADSTFKLESNNSFGGSISEDTAIEYIRKKYEAGLYVVVCSAGLYNSFDHYSPIVGWDEETDKPIVWDVAGGGKTWHDWAVTSYGINQIVTYSSSLNKSYDVLGKSLESSNVNKELSDEQKEAVQRVITEWELHGMPENFEFGVDIALPGEESLSEVERISMENIKENIASKRLRWYDYARIGVSFLGLCCIVYGFLLGLAYLFDRTNNLLEISLLGILTLGRYKIWEDGSGIEKGYNKDDDIFYCDSNTLLIRMAIVEVVGFILVSGIVFNIISKVVLAILNMV